MISKAEKQNFSAKSTASFEERRKNLLAKYDISADHESGQQKSSFQEKRQATLSKYGIAARDTTSSFEEKREKRLAQYGIYDDSVRGVTRETKDLLDEINGFYSKWSKDSGNLAGYQKRISDLGGRISTWKGKATSEEEKRGLDDLSSVLASIGKYADGQSKYYSQWKSADEYNYYQKYKGLTDDQQQAEVGKLKESTSSAERKYERDNAQRELDWLYQNGSDSVRAMGRQDAYSANVAQLDALKAERGELLNTAKGDARKVVTRYGALGAVVGTDSGRRIAEIDSEISRLETEIRNYERGNEGSGYKTADDYLSYTQAEGFKPGYDDTDYGNASKEDYDRWYYQTYGGKTIRSSDAEVLGTSEAGHADVDKESLSIPDPLGFWKQNNEKRSGTEYLANGVNYRDYDWILQQAQTGSWKMLNDTDVGIYYQILKTQGTDAAMKYLTDMELELNRREYRQEQTDLTKRYDEASTLEKIAMNIATVPGQFAGAAFGFVDDALRTVTGQDINPYNSAHYGSMYSSTVRGEEAKTLDEATGNKNLIIPGFTVGDLYQSLMSAADSWAGAKFLGPGVYGTLMGMGAASSEAQKLYESGASKEQVALGSMLAGAAEMIFEEVSLDKLISMGDSKTIAQAIKHALIQGGIEASEETFTELSNILTNALVMGDQSDWNKTLRDNNGDVAKTLADKALDVANAAAGGFVSGGVGGAAGAGENYFQYQNQINREGRAIRSTENGVASLRELATQMQQEEDYAKSRDAISEKLNAMNRKVDGNTSERAKNKATGRMMDTVRESIASRNAVDIQAALEEGGIGEQTAKTLSEALAADLRGSGMTSKQRELLSQYRNNSRVQEIMQRITENADSAVSKRLSRVDNYTDSVREDLIRKAVESATSREDSTKEQEAEKSFDVSGTSENILRNESGENESVNVSRVASVENGTVMVELSDGRTVNADSISYANRGDAVMYAALSEMDMSAQAANYLLAEQRESKNDAITFAMGVQEAYRAGRDGTSLSRISERISGLTDSQKRNAYRIGAEAAANQTQTRQNAIPQRTTQKNKSGKVMYEVNLKGRNLSEQQRTGVQYAEFLAAAGVNVHVYESTKGADGKYHSRFGTVNGTYMSESGDIYLDLASGSNGQGTVAYTVSHEFTHFIEDWSPSRFRAFANALFMEMDKSGDDVDAMLKQKQEELRNRSDYAGKSERELQDIAYSEVVAECCETMLTDTDAAQRLTKRIQAQDKSLWEKIVSFFKDLANRLTAAYRDMNLRPDSTIANQARETISRVEQLRDLWADAGADAIAAFREAKEGQKKNTQKGVNNGILFMERGGGVKESSKLTEEDLSYLLDMVQNRALDDNSYIPLRANTPQFLIDVIREHSMGKFAVQNLPMASSVKHLIQNMEEEDGFSYGNDRPHGLSKDDIIAISKGMGNPAYIVLQKNGRYAEVVSFYNSRNKKVVVSISFADDKNNFKHVQYMNGYDAGYYNIIVTEFEPDNLKAYLKGCEIVYDKSKMNGKYQVGSGRVVAITHDIPFITDTVAQSDSGVKKNSSRDSDGGMSNRQLLANTLESAVQNDMEREKLQQYRDKIKQASEQQQKLGELKQELKELSFATGKRDKARISALQSEITATANRLNIIDRQLLRLEATKTLKDLLEREREGAMKKAKAKGRETMQTYREGRSRTAMRHKVQGIVKELDNYLLNATKEKHVPVELQEAVAVALDSVNMDTVGAQKRIESLQKRLANATTDQQRKDLTKRLYRVMDLGGRMDDKLQQLHDAYSKFQDHEDPLVSMAFDEVISNKILETIPQIGNTALKDMNTKQLNAVYDMYKAVLTRVRDANKAFVAGKNQRISEISTQAIRELKAKKQRSPYTTPLQDKVDSFFWNNEKPVYAFERIGSKTLTTLYNNLRKGEDTWITDVSAAKDFFQKTAKEHGYHGWDLEQTHTFTASSGKRFQLNLEQIMSLYAYSRRPQAADHIRRGGIVIDENTKVTVEGVLGVKRKFNVSDATAYNISDETLSQILDTLTDDQKAFAEAMQKYLSDDMGSKGNEVSMQLYGINLFGEKNYWPLRSAQQYMQRAKEQAENPNNKMKNAGMTKGTIEHASNPIVLTGFMDTWANHVNEMSMYHAMVLPMEDFYRVYNWKTATHEVAATESMQMLLENTVGKSAVSYIDQFLKDLNGGVRSDPRETVSKAMISKFKKAAVFTSASVIIQQPSAVGRAFSLVDPKYFVGSKVDGLNQSGTWEQCKKYAPIAAIKEMGMFDTDMGRSTADFIKAQEYENFGEKAGAFFTDSGYRDDVLGWAPGKADEITWCAIWDACKRETAAKTTLTGEQLLRAAGERFTDVITKTQVYDSVFSRSANMRSKSGLMNMVTSFMAEPTTSINMLEDSYRKLRMGYTRAAGRTLASVATAAVINALLVSFVYAARDDDEDKTYLEKYLSNVVTGVMDGINPITSIPYLRDVWSLLQGYSVDRADMSLISDAASAFSKIVTLAGKDTSEMTEAQLEAHHASQVEAAWKAADSMFSIFGIPEKNIRREINAVINMFKSSNWEDSSVNTIWNSVWDDVKASTPVLRNLQKDSKSDRLYAAYISGDAVYKQRMENRYSGQQSLDTALKKGLRDNDQRIRQAAIAMNAGKNDERIRITKEIIAEGNFSQNTIVAAINDEASAIKEGKSDPYKQKEQSLYTVEDFAKAASDGKTTTAMKKELIRALVANGKTEDEAGKSLKTSTTSKVKEMFSETKFSRTQAVTALVNSGFYSKDEAETKVDNWEFEVDYGYSWSDRGEAYLNGAISAAQLRAELVASGKTSEEANLLIEKYDWQKVVPGSEDISSSAISNYNSFCASTGVSKSAFYKAWKEINDIESDRDSDGNTVTYSKTFKVADYINGLNLSAEQKTAVMMCWYSEKTVEKYKKW